MRRLLAAIVTAITLAIIIKGTLFVGKDIRLRSRFSVCRALAHYVVDNNGVFPANWESLTRFNNTKYAEKSSKSQFEQLKGTFSLPWNENITNTSAMACAWFKSLNKERRDEDRFFSRFALGEMCAFMTNNPALRIYIDAALAASGKGVSGKGGVSGHTDKQD